ncbi:MAG: lipopolysaccharide heptosyltransferase II [Candidatus Omnitrophota bacterium]
MKILLLSPSLNAGGVETGTIDLSKELKRIGEEIIVVSSGGQLVAELDKYDIKHIQLPIHRKSLITFLQVSKLSRIINAEHIDIVHAQSRVPAWVAYFACKNTRIPLITSCHGYYSKHLFSRVMGWGKRVIVISEIIGKHMQENFKVSKDRIRLVYRGVDLSRYQFQPEKPPKDKFIIVNISRITPIKGQREFIKAINVVASQFPDIEVWIVGSADKKNKQYEISLYSLVKDLKLKDKVKFLGSRQDIPQILKDSDLLVLSTQMPEAFGRVIIEAGASGVPVCATRTGGIVEIIEDKKDGVLFDSGNTDAMAKAIISMMRYKELRQQCKISLRDKVESNFSLDKMSIETLGVYREIVAKKRILIIKIGGLGDLILATPSFKMLRHKFSKATISLLVNSDYESIIKDCPYIDEIIPFDRKKKELMQLVKDLKKQKFDVSIDFKNSNRSHLIAYLSGIPARYGFSKELTGSLLNRAEPFFRDSAESPVRQQFRILQRMGVRDFDDSLQLWTNKREDDLISEELKKRGIQENDKLIGLAIGASAEWPTKDWPIENFSKLSKMLLEKGLKVILIGLDYSKDKEEILLEEKGIISFVGQTSLTQLVSLVKKLDILVTPDSAPLHIASAVGTQTIAFFGPTDPAKHIPPGGKTEVLVKKIYCQPCYKRNCKNKENLACLHRISVEEVCNLIIQKIK